MGCGERLTEGRNDILKAKLLLHLAENTFVASSISLATFYVSIGLEAEAELCIFLITNAYIYVFHERTHHRDSLL